MTARTLAGRLARLEAKAGLGPPRGRMYVRCANTGEWLGEGPPEGVLQPQDRVMDIAFINPDGSMASAEELRAEAEVGRR